MIVRVLKGVNLLFLLHNHFKQYTLNMLYRTDNPNVLTNRVLLVKNYAS